jgi:hypothetical protein
MHFPRRPLFSHHYCSFSSTITVAPFPASVAEKRSLPSLPGRAGAAFSAVSSLDETKTYAQYFKDSAKDMVVQYHALEVNSKAAGAELTAENEQYLAELLASDITSCCGEEGTEDDFYAYLKQQGYNFKPGSNYACDVSQTEAAAKAAQHKRHYEGGGCSTCGKTVETGWKE